MGRLATIALDWLGDIHTFAVRWRQLVELQEACNAGPSVVYARLLDGTWRVTDISHTIRIGLIGGGASPAAAAALVRKAVEARPPADSLELAIDILAAGLLAETDEKSAAPLGDKGERIDDLPSGKLRVASIYGALTAIGIPPGDADQLSLWQVFAAINGYAKAHAPRDDRRITAEEADDLWSDLLLHSARTVDPLGAPIRPHRYESNGHELFVN